MIRYVKGALIGKSDRGVIVYVGGDPKQNGSGVGYDIELPVNTRRALSAKTEGESVELYISFQQSQNQPTPRLYGFSRELERDFFEELIRVKDVGPSMVLAAMTIPVAQIARAILDRDVKTLKSLKSIGEKTAEKIIAELRNRVAKYALLPEDAVSMPEEAADFRVEVREALVKQLEFKPAEAQKAIEEAVKRNSSIASAEDLFDEVLRGHK